MKAERLGSLENLALDIAVGAHLGQIDKSGNDYILCLDSNEL